MKIVLKGNKCDLCMAYTNESSFDYVICDKEQNILKKLETKSFLLAKEQFYLYDQSL